MTISEPAERLNCSDIDASRITHHLYVGSLPPPGDAVARAGFQALVLCAADFQPPPHMFQRLTLVYAPFWDGALTPTELATANGAAKVCVQLIRTGAIVLVTCAEGRNRSALVAAMTVHATTGLSGLDCIRLLRSRRKPPGGREVLTNPHFVQLLARL